jgi:hypothetical protein
VWIVLIKPWKRHTEGTRICVKTEAANELVRLGVARFGVITDIARNRSLTANGHSVARKGVAHA